MSICVLVADSSKARIFSAQNGHSALQEDIDFSHSESRLKEQDLVADGVGSASDAGGYGKHSMGHENAAHQRQAEIFAHRLGSELDKIRQCSNLHRIYLVAAPKFLGLLRGSLSSQCTALLADEINKDLTIHSIKDIRSHLPKHL
jgi:protein required for attachment to host cells